MDSKMLLDQLWKGTVTATELFASHRAVCCCFDFRNSVGNGDYYVCKGKVQAVKVVL